MLRPADLDGWCASPSTGIPTMTVAGQRWILTRLPLSEELFSCRRRVARPALFSHELESRGVSLRVAPWNLENSAALGSMYLN